MTFAALLTVAVAYCFWWGKRLVSHGAAKAAALKRLGQSVALRSKMPAVDDGNRAAVSLSLAHISVISRLAQPSKAVSCLKTRKPRAW